MSSNEQVLLERLLDQDKLATAPSWSDADFFELFCAQQVLKNYSLSYDEIEAGLIDSSGDGGIDSIYAFVNGDLITDDTDVSSLKEDIRIRLVLIQSSREKTFSQVRIERLLPTLRDLLELSKTHAELRQIYNEDLVRNIENFKRAFLQLTSRHPRITFDFYYCTRGHEVHPNVRSKIPDIERTVKEKVSPSEVSFTFVGTRQLLDLSRELPTISIPLKVAENPISTSADGFICLVGLKEYYEFISDHETKELRKWLFESNVRDYEGAVEVNKAIKETLENPGDEDFWWLNNGITIVAAKAPLAAKILTMENPRVVNGLQTSIEIHQYFRNHVGNSDESRNILVRVVVPTSASSRNKIIKATNNQTRISSIALHATEQLQMDLEQHFLTYGCYYERLKNHYKNQGRPKDRIFTPTFVAQAVVAILLKEPNNARGRPTSLINRDDDYKRIFNENYPFDLYLECSKFMKAVDEYLATRAPEESRKDKTNIRFALAFFASAIKAGAKGMSVQRVKDMGFESIDEEFLLNCLVHVKGIYDDLKETLLLPGDTIAKSRDFDSALMKRINKVINDGFELA